MVDSHCASRSAASSVATRSASTPPAASCVAAGARVAMRVCPTTAWLRTSTACRSTRPSLAVPSGWNTCSKRDRVTCNCGIWALVRSASSGPWRERRSVRR
ncbi:hypothetical protein AD428_10330 [Achromobacter sp. DMS1]|nr:hypothetical protein AD428_10330 [Achromobacter sp. DMS1]